MVRRKSEAVRFVAKYEDGSQEYFDIDRQTLKRGEHATRLIARERQEEGKLAAGKIIRVCRDDE